ncbi:electron transport complex subunit RsxC [Atlantibacter sp.]|uniref:electron transport complex subunit RsxC n=1 Tax=Atlantibacter sp. TaxID=1903473 RepID=UPI0028AE13E9|nr:electron transport complex subunit RsxC [Atlantibacter sp.]
MFKLFSAFRKEKIWDFDGGIHPPEMKSQSSGTPLRQVPLPGRFIIPLKQHIGAEGELCVQVGDSVLRGQPLTRGWGKMLPVHAPTSGTVVAITPHSTAHPSALAELSVIIEPDGDDRWIARDGWHDYTQRSREELIERIHQFGVAGLGGAGFPTGVKLRGGGDKIETLIINAAECEPYITADDRLMQECAAQIIEGIRILAWILKPREVLIGIEDNKPQAISMLRAVLCHEPDITLRVIPTKYPSGGAKQLTQILTGKQVPHGGRSSDIGVLMHNVGTAYAVKRAVIDGEPLTERVVTLTGESVTKPGNVWARLGTPVRHLLDFGGFCPTSDQLVIMGGPLMGFTLPWLDVPVVKITNCLLAPSSNEMGEPQEEQHCIRCSACADACPADLLPQQLYWFSKGQQHDKATAHNLSDCIECGACAWVCPSNIPLVQYFRQEKAEIRAVEQEALRAAEAKARFEARQRRLEREKAARLERHKKAAVQPDAQDKDAIHAALSRVREKNASDVIVIKPNSTPDNQAAIAAREARKAQARARQAQKVALSEGVEPASDAPVDPRKAAVEAAIARAKARKAAAAEPTAAESMAEEHAAVKESNAPVDPRKAAVEAAIARAKARKAAAAEPTAAESTAEEHAAVNESNAPVDPRKAAVEAAIARAKARKAAAAEPTAAESTTEEQVADSVSTTPVDPRKAAVEAAIARAKARKAAAAEPTAAESTAEEHAAVNVNNAPVDPRKAAVEAAIARAKARKAAAAEPTASEPTAEEHAAVNVNNAPVDPRKAAVEAAIARAKARKAAAAEPTTTESTTEEQAAVNESNAPVDPRKAAVEAAIARAKARKAAAAEHICANDEPEDPRKAAVAAAIARAQAKKAAQKVVNED